ncbi:MAG: hypothetical protein LBS96_01230, partial [Oscillospiraceae bacterium]|nr:hypothetical protein [Oscillospiraceae bacterium]
TCFASYSHSLSDGHGTSGSQGCEYGLFASGSKYGVWRVVDDPSGLAQLVTVQAGTDYFAASTTTAKVVRSWYVHTWSSSCSLSVSASTATTPDLTFTVSGSSNYWKIANPVTFNF